jgi:hypothetical protein
MNKTQEALKLAIEALEDAQNMIGDGGNSIPNYFLKPLNVSKEALAEQQKPLSDNEIAWHNEQMSEPVAWITEDTITSFGYLKYGYIDRKDRAIPDCWQPLYAKKG